VAKSAYEDTLPNNLNTSGGIYGLSALQADRDLVINEIATMTAEWILPRSETIFGPLVDITGTESPGLNIFLYDINDGFGGGGGFVSGYFDPDDKNSHLSGGNKMNALHMDIYPSVVGGYDQGGFGGLRRTDFFHVLAHELQHVIHYQFDPDEAVWVNEGFSQFAIYRMFHGRSFFSGSRYLEVLGSPTDAASQVRFWLENPRTARLMDEDGTYGVELRGLGYLFFCYLWEQIGGDFTDDNAGDEVFRQMVASTARGRSSLQAGLDTIGRNFNDIFASFPVALLIDGGHDDFRMDFFDEHYSAVHGTYFRLRFDGCYSPGCDAGLIADGMSNIIYPLQSYDFWFVRLQGHSEYASVVRLDAMGEFSSALVAERQGLRTLEEYNTGRNHLIYVPRGESCILALINPTSSQLNIEFSFGEYLNAEAVELAHNAVSTFVDGAAYDSSALNISALSVTKQMFSNFTTATIDILNSMPDRVAITACDTASGCVNPSLSRVAGREYLPSVSYAYTYGDQTYYPSGLALESGKSYFVYFVNKTVSPVSFSPLITRSGGRVVGTVYAPSPTEETAPVSSSTGKAAGCFIATASYGPGFFVSILSGFRDGFLMTNRPGQAFVNFYYAFSPPVAEFIAGSVILKWLCRIALLPLVLFAALFVYPLWALLSGVLLFSALFCRRLLLRVRH
jgi:hypothetical protein